MKSEDNVRLFPCRDKTKFFPGMGGISFNIMNELPLDDSLCVYGGPACKFEGMMRFVASQRQHQFIVGGFMFFLPHRQTKDTRQSASLMEGKIAIVGRRPQSTRIRQAYTTILRPFQTSTWMLLLGFASFFVLIRAIISWYFADPRNADNFVKNIVGEHDPKHIRPLSTANQERLRVLHKIAVVSLTFAVSAFGIITVLFYEISVVNFLFLKKTHNLQKKLSNLTPQEMREFIIIEGGGTEVIFTALADPHKKYEKVKPPWHYCKAESEWYVYMGAVQRKRRLLII